MTKIEESIHSTTVEMESSRLMKLPFETLEAIFSHVSVIAHIPVDSLLATFYSTLLFTTDTCCDCVLGRPRGSSQPVFGFKVGQGACCFSTLPISRMHSPAQERSRAQVAD